MRRMYAFETWSTDIFLNETIYFINFSWKLEGYVWIDLQHIFIQNFTLIDCGTSKFNLIGSEVKGGLKAPGPTELHVISPPSD